MTEAGKKEADDLGAAERRRTSRRDGGLRDLSDGFQTLGFLNFSGLLIKPVSVDMCKIFGSKYF